MLRSPTLSWEHTLLIFLFPFILINKREETGQL